jgi:hypothetical protein
MRMQLLLLTQQIQSDTRQLGGLPTNLPSTIDWMQVDSWTQSWTS